MDKSLGVKIIMDISRELRASKQYIDDVLLEYPECQTHRDLLTSIFIVDRMNDVSLNRLEVADFYSDNDRALATLPSDLFRYVYSPPPMVEFTLDRLCFKAMALVNNTLNVNAAFKIKFNDNTLILIS